MASNGEIPSMTGRGKWNFAPNTNLLGASMMSIRGFLGTVMSNLPSGGDSKDPIPLGHGDPSVFPCFRTTIDAEDAVVDALRSGEYNCYGSTVGLAPARSAVAEYLSKDLPYELSPDDVYLTVGCSQAIEIMFSVIARTNANILLPKLGYPFYEARAVFEGMEFRNYNLLPDRNWEVDLDSVKAIADENTVAIVISSPGNPCGNVFTYEHLSKVAETAKNLGIMVISDEVYSAFGSTPFVPMGVFGSVVPVITLGSISKKWVVPGWRFGWIVTTDPNGVFKKTKIVDGIKAILNISSDPVTFIQGAIPQMLKNTKDDFFRIVIHLLKRTSDICYEKINEIDCITCPSKPEGSMFIMVNLDLSYLNNINDDMDFCCKLANEESVVILPGSALGYKNWLRITFAVDPSALEEGLRRLKAFCQRHAKLKVEACV